MTPEQRSVIAKHGPYRVETGFALAANGNTLAKAWRCQPGAMLDAIVAALNEIAAGVAEEPHYRQILETLHGFAKRNAHRSEEAYQSAVKNQLGQREEDGRGSELHSANKWLGLFNTYESIAAEKRWHLLDDFPKEKQFPPGDTWEDGEDEYSPAIHEAYPPRYGQHEHYATAMRMVGKRRSKGSLVALVTWLLVERHASRASQPPPDEPLPGYCLRLGATSFAIHEGMSAFIGPPRWWVVGTGHEVFATPPKLLTYPTLAEAREARDRYARELGDDRIRVARVWPARAARVEDVEGRP
jgi:hypothetical protein